MSSDSSDADRAAQDGSGRRRGRGRSSRRDFEIQCHRCGATDTVPFKPKPGRELLCSACMRRKREQRDSESRSRSEGARPPSGAQRNDNMDRPSVTPPDPSSRSSWRVTCSHCGATDTVPFKPRRGGAVLCARCLQDPHVVRIGGRVLHSIVCAGCGQRDQVPFKPDLGSRVLCGSCHRQERDARNRARERFWSRHPGEVDGERVRIEGRCDECGSDDGFSYVPRPTDRSLCRGCVERQFGEHWARRRLVGPEVPQPCTCALCGETRFVKASDGDLLCGSCARLYGLARDPGTADGEPWRVWLETELP